MSTLAVKTDERVSGVSFDLERLIVDLMDGRTIAVPLAWYPRLLEATSGTAFRLGSSRRRLWNSLAAD